MTWWAARTVRCERGTSVTEYALIITGVAMVMVAVVGFFADEVTAMWGSVAALM